MKEKKLTIPLQEEETKKIDAGDIVYLDGTIFTGRIRFYEKVIVNNEKPPIDIAKTCNVNFHCSPAVSELDNGSYYISSVTGTASFRFEKYLEQLFERYQVKAIIGKGGMRKEYYEDVFFPNGVVYFLTVGYGLGATYGKSIIDVENVFWKEEFGLAQAMWIIRVRDFGPLLVDFDLKGNCLEDSYSKEINKTFSTLINEYPLPSLKRSGELSFNDVSKKVQS